MVKKYLEDSISEYGMRLIKLIDFNNKTMIDVSASLRASGIFIDQGNIVILPYRGYKGRNYNEDFDFFNDGSAIAWFKLHDDISSSPIIFNEGTKVENGSLGKSGRLSTYDLGSSERAIFYKGLRLHGNSINFVDFGNDSLSNRNFMGEQQDIVISTWINVKSIVNTDGVLLNYLTNSPVSVANNRGFMIKARKTSTGYVVVVDRFDEVEETSTDSKGYNNTAYGVSITSKELHYNVYYNVIAHIRRDGNIKIFINGVLDNYLPTSTAKDIKYENDYTKTTSTSFLGYRQDDNILSLSQDITIDNWRFFSKSNFTEANALSLFNEN